ncbi:hypothetical protein ACSU6B_28395 [Neobacillus sp. C211]|uniref:hypothetical protein n=1 Tax=unclassified Neobacillus TaxID=2675272 RepID=UPI00397A77E3
MKPEDKVQKQKKVQRLYRKIKQENDEEKNSSLKEAAIIVFIIFIIAILNAMFKGF